MMIKVTWTGAAGLCFDYDGKSILIDPYFTRIGIWQTLFKPIAPDRKTIDEHLAAIQAITAVVVSHTHTDHALDVPYIASRSDALIIGSASLDTLMRINLLPARTTVCRGGERVVLPENACVTMIPSVHGTALFGKVPFAGEISPDSVPPMKARQYRIGTVFAPKLELGGKTFLHFGSANFCEEHLAGHICDVLFLCVTGWQKRSGYPETLLSLTQPETIVLFHYDDFSKPHRPGSPVKAMPLINMKALIERIKCHAPQSDLIIPEIGESIEISTL